jgi:hypothetical protein
MPNWSESAERRLLLSYIQVTNPDVPDWKTVADRTGLGFSNEACRYIGLPAQLVSFIANFLNRQRFAKIKKADAEAFSAGGANAEDSVTSNSVDGADTPATTPKPKAKRAPRTPKTKSTGGKRGVKLLDGEDDEEEPQTPTKKPKVEKKVKHEPVEDKVDEI